MFIVFLKILHFHIKISTSQEINPYSGELFQSFLYDKKAIFGTISIPKHKPSLLCKQTVLKYMNKIVKFLQISHQFDKT